MLSLGVIVVLLVESVCYVVLCWVWLGEFICCLVCGRVSFWLLSCIFWLLVMIEWWLICWLWVMLRFMFVLWNSVVVF